MAATPDSEHVGRIENEVLRRFCTARDAGDEAAAHQHYQRFITLQFDRIRAFVRIEADGRLNPRELEEAEERAMIRVGTKVRDSFRGSSVGAWVLVARQAVHFACIDAQDDAIKRRERETSFDAHRSGDDERDGYEKAEYATPPNRVSVDEADEIRDDFFAGESAFLDWAVPRLPKRPREVFELMRQGKQTKEIMEILGINENNVHVSYKRALEKLRTLRPDYEP